MRTLSLRPVALSLLISLASSGPAFAAGQITFVSQGGSYQEAQTKAILDPAANLLGITVNQDSTPTHGRRSRPKARPASRSGT